MARTVNNINNADINVFPSLTREWEDFTDTHKNARKKAEEAISQYAELLDGSKPEAPPLIIAGGLGSGKTQLLYHLFKYSWIDKRIPAFYLDLKSLIKIVRDNMVANGKTGRLMPKEFDDEISSHTFKKLELLKEHFYEDKYDLSSLWLPELTGQQSRIPPVELFKSIKADTGDVYNTINKILQKRQGVILLIDEVEIAYKELKDLIEGGIRDLVDIVGRGVVPIYIVMAVSYLSYYELFLSEFTGDIAFARRVRLVQIPPIDPETLHERLRPLKLEDRSNTFWWFTRGRVGWLTHLKDVIVVDDKADLLEWTKYQQLRTTIAENLHIFDVEELLNYENKYCRGDENCKAGLRYLVLNIRPLKVDGLPQFVKDSLAKLSEALVYCDVPVSGTEAVESFIEDITDFCDSQSLSLREEDKRLIRDALNNVLSALATYDDEGKELCIGAKDNFSLSDTAIKYVDSILSILMTYIAENYPSSDESRSVNETLYIVYSKALNSEMWKQDITFQRVKGLFMKHTGRNYVMIAPWVLQSFIPMYLSNPIISDKPGLDINTLEEELRSTLLEEDEDLILNLVDKVSGFITVSSRYRGSDFSLHIIPIPRAQYMDEQVKEKMYNIVKDILDQHQNDIKFAPKKILLLFPGADDSFAKEVSEKLSKEDLLYDLMIKITKRIYVGTVAGERLSDFVKSLFVMLHDESEASTVEGVVEKLSPDQKRRVDYFRTTLGSWLSEFIEGFYQEPIEKLRVSNPDELKSVIVKDLETLKRFLDRASKFRLHTKAHAALYISLARDVRNLFNENMHYTLSPGGLIRISSLPSIYQEFEDTFLVTPQKLLGIFPINSIADVALKDKKGSTLGESLKILEEEKLSLYNDFVSVISDLSIDTNEWENELLLLYRLLLFIRLLYIRKDEVIDRFHGSSERVKTTILRLSQLLDDIENVCKEMCKSSPVCIKIRIGSKNKTRSLADEIKGIRDLLETLEQWTKDTSSNSNPERYLMLSFVTVFGLPDEENELLRQIEEKASEWFSKLNENIYSQLSNLQSTLNKSKAIFKGDSKIEKELSIDSLDSINSVRNTLSEIYNEFDHFSKDYSSKAKKIEELKRDIINELKDLKDKISKIKEEVDKA